ncbi:MAG: WbqC family protein [Promethearchaeota archaeon]
MILTAHQPAYLPWLGFFHKLLISDIAVILDNVQFQKNYFINRNKIRTNHGDTWLTVPVLTSGHIDKRMIEMKINNNINWHKKHKKSINIHYKKAPYFLNYYDYFEKLYDKNWIYLTDLLKETMSFFFKELNIETKIYYQSNLGFKKKKQDLILEMCEYFDSDIFVFGKDGRKYADPEYFKLNKRNIYFQDYNHPTYPQLHGDFIPYLSVLDLLFNVGSEKALEIIMKENITKNELNRKFQLI